MKGQRQQLTDSYIYTTVRMGIANSFFATASRRQGTRLQLDQDFVVRLRYTLASAAGFRRPFRLRPLNAGTPQSATRMTG